MGFKGPPDMFKSIYNGNIALEDVEKGQKNLELKLGATKQGNPKNRSEEQSKVINNVTNLYESIKKSFKCLMIILEKRETHL